MASKVIDKHAASTILNLLIQTEGTISIQDGVAVTPDGTSIDLRQAFLDRKYPCKYCLDRPGRDGVGRICKKCGGSGEAAEGAENAFTA